MSSPHTSFTSSPRAWVVTCSQLYGAPPPVLVRSSRTRGSTVKRWSCSQVPSVLEWSATTSSKSSKLCPRMESIVSSMKLALL